LPLFVKFSKTNHYMAVSHQRHEPLHLLKSETPLA
jgi:hypothetical protein